MSTGPAFDPSTPVTWTMNTVYIASALFLVLVWSNRLGTFAFFGKLVEDGSAASEYAEEGRSESPV